MSPIKAISGRFLSIVNLQALSNSQASKAEIPPCSMPISRPIAPEKKLNATISGKPVVVRGWSSGSIEIL
jgi:hypothetical protein